MKTLCRTFGVKADDKMSAWIEKMELQDYEFVQAVAAGEYVTIFMKGFEAELTAEVEDDSEEFVIGD